MNIYKIVDVSFSGKYVRLMLEDRLGGFIEHSCKATDLVELYSHDDDIFGCVMTHGLTGLYVAIDTHKTRETPPIYSSRIEALICGPLSWRNAAWD